MTSYHVTQKKQAEFRIERRFKKVAANSKEIQMTKDNFDFEFESGFDFEFASVVDFNEQQIVMTHDQTLIFDDI